MNARTAWLWVAAAAALTACGRPEPRWKLRTATEWAEGLWSPSKGDVDMAYAELSAFAQQRPGTVLAAIERHLLRSPPPPAASPFELRVDFERARRLGLPDLPPEQPTHRVLPVLRARLEALRLVPATLKASGDGMIDIVAPGDRGRAEIERAQVVLTRRGALDLRVVVPDPAARAPGEPSYDGSAPWADHVAAEAAAWIAAEAAGTEYRPSDPRWRVVPTRADAPAAPADFVLVAEPREAREAIDDLIASDAVPVAEGDGSAFVRVTVKPERAEDVRRFAARHAGREMAVIVDGVVRARVPVPATDGRALLLPLGPAPGGPAAAAAWAEEHAIALRTGRLPWPLEARPLPSVFHAPPPPDSPFSRLAAAIGEDAVPMLERVFKGNGPEWGKAAAEWALEQIRNP